MGLGFRGVLFGRILGIGGATPDDGVEAPDSGTVGDSKLLSLEEAK